MHKPYEEIRAHIADFRVRYRFIIGEGGRLGPPYQAYRSDFKYEHPLHDGYNQLFMIHPEFENDNGEIILDDKEQVSINGTARMWILIPERRIYHEDKIFVGTKGFFMEGSRKVAECEVIEILGLLTNPRENDRKR
jgi:hypothetical protein